MNSTDEDRKNTAPLSGESAAVHSEKPNSEPVAEGDDPELQDITKPLLGGKAIIGKAVWSANNSARNGAEDAQERNDKEQDAEDRETRELMHLAEWNAQMTTVGGVSMTNEQAQAARRHIIENDDYYARRAVAQGRINAGEVDDYKFTARRIWELKDREGRGIATSEDGRECARRINSRVGRALERDAGELHAAQAGLAAEPTIREAASPPMLRTSAASALDGDVFQGTPKLSPQFAEAHAAAAKNGERRVEPDVALPMVTPSGLDL